MRRIYESRALQRDDEDPFRPNERDERTSPRAARTLPAGKLSNTLVPSWLRHRAISLSISTPQSVYSAGTAVPFTVEMKNAMPFPITVPTLSPLLWTWQVDGLQEASHVPEEPPQEPGGLAFDRGEWKSFGRRWNGMFQISNAEWTEADPGEYTISAAINVEAPVDKGVYDETTVRIE